MGYFALLGSISFFLYKLSQESKQCFKRFGNEIFSDDLRKGVKVLIWKRCWWKTGRFYLKTNTNVAFDKSLKAPAVQPKVASTCHNFFY